MGTKRRSTRAINSYFRSSLHSVSPVSLVVGFKIEGRSLLILERGRVDPFQADHSILVLSWKAALVRIGLQKPPVLFGYTHLRHGVVEQRYRMPMVGSEAEIVLSRPRKPLSEVVKAFSRALKAGSTAAIVFSRAPKPLSRAPKPLSRAPKPLSGALKPFSEALKPLSEVVKAFSKALKAGSMYSKVFGRAGKPGSMPLHDE